MFKSTVLLVPGLGNSNEDHWQSYWQKRYHFQRVNQHDWETPKCEDWITTLDSTISHLNTEDIILVGHSLACATISRWAHLYERTIKAALLVAPADTEATCFPPEATGFAPMSLYKLPFASIVVASTNDPYVSLDRAKHFANSWGSQFINIGHEGHINSESYLKHWAFGIILLRQLDNIDV